MGGTQHLYRRRQTHTTALRDSRTGRLAGQWKRRLGVAESMARAAITVLADVYLFQHLHLLIAMLDLPIGSPVGRLPKKLGVAPMPERAALHRMAAVLDCQCDIAVLHAGAPAQARHLRVLLAA